jgi:hypothetical membrane protein
MAKKEFGPEQRRGKAMSSLQRILNPKVTAILGVFGHLITFTFIFLAISASPWFTWTNYALSNLGDLTRSSAPLFNGGLVIGGTTLLLFALGLGLRVKASRLATIGTVLLFASAVGAIGVGIFPMNILLPHIIFAVTIFLSDSIAIFIFAFEFTLRKSRFLSILSISLGTVASLVWFLPWGAGIAIPEFIASLATYFWILVICTRLVTQRGVIPTK